MTVEVVDDAREFLERAAPLVARDPISTNVIATVTANYDPTDPTVAGPARWALVSDGGDPLGAAMLTPPWNLFLSALPAGAAADIADVLTAAGIELPGVAGAADAVREFVDRWATIHHVQSRLDRRQRAFVLDELLEPGSLDGFARLVRPGEAPLLAAWWQRFHDEAVPRDPALDWSEVATTQIERGGVWCWCVGDTPVSFAAANHMGDLARIGPVYTPPDRRGRGFAAAATAAAVRDALTQGAHHVMLYADVENPTSNALYLRLGFIVHHDAEQYAFI